MTIEKRTTVLDFFSSTKEFSDTLDEAEGNAKNDFEVEFMSTLRERFEEFGPRTSLSQKQYNIIRRLID